MDFRPHKKELKRLMETSFLSRSEVPGALSEMLAIAESLPDESDDPIDIAAVEKFTNFFREAETVWAESQAEVQQLMDRVYHILTDEAPTQ